MCGRTACILNRDELRQATIYRNRQSRATLPQWTDDPGGKQYYTSYNKAPGSYCPVLISAHHVDKKSDSLDQVLQPMLWSLVPSWHKGGLDTLPIKTVNCRDDSLLTKNTFKSPLQKGHRCVIVADGFYEWERSNSKKQPYYIYLPPKDGERRLLTMAGVFDINTHAGETPLYSYSVITVSSSPKMAKVHHRMPAILDGEDAIRDWLNVSSVPLEKAISLIKPTSNIAMHAVSSLVNNSRNNSPDCIIPADEVKKPVTSLMKWLKPTKKTDAEKSLYKDDKQTDDIKKPQTLETDNLKIEVKDEEPTPKKPRVA